jgi:hypothetical protein
VSSAGEEGSCGGLERELQNKTTAEPILGAQCGIFTYENSPSMKTYDKTPSVKIPISS